MLEERQESPQPFSATDSMKKLVIDKMSKTIDMACRREEPIANYTTETGFVRSVKLMKSLLLRHTPDEISRVITELYKKLDKEIEDIEKSSWSESTKAVNKMKVSDDVSMQVLELLTVVIQYSSMSTEYKDMEVFGDFKELIKTIRSPEPVKMFATEIESEA